MDHYRRWDGRAVLVTGADGFVGAHFVEHVLMNTAARIVCLCSFSNGGLGSRLSSNERVSQEMGRRVSVMYHDLRAPFSDMQVHKLRNLGVTHVVNFASMSHVDHSISAPAAFIDNNVRLITNILDLARKIECRSFVQISTDEVYGPAYGGHRHKEWETIAPSNPYAASKAAQEAICFGYWRAYGTPVVITNTMNNIGERQSAEKFLPLIVRSVLQGKPVTIHAVGQTVGSRYYLHARNHADAVMYVADSVVSYEAPGRQFPFARRPERFNVVGEMELTNLELAEYVADVLNKKLRFELVDAHSARPGHDLRYALCGEKLSSLGWSAPVPLLESIKRTVLWYRDNPEWLHHSAYDGAT